MPRHVSCLRRWLLLLCTAGAIGIWNGGQLAADDTASRPLLSFVRQPDADPLAATAAAAQAAANVIEPQQKPTDTAPALPPLPASTAIPATKVVPVSAEEKAASPLPEPAPADSRRLLLRPRESEPTRNAADGRKPPKLPFALPNLDSLGTAGAGLALVLGLFLLCVALFRKSGPRPTAPLPRDVITVLGRVPISGKHFAQLIQLGNKLVLVAVSPDSIDPIAEVTDPIEVDRLLSLCMKTTKQSSSAEFQRVLQQLAKEPARGFLGQEAISAYARSKA
jgi:flagellar biogenesis protein FliO